MKTGKYQKMAPFVLRLAVGAGFINHGWAKLSRGPAGFEQLLKQLGVPFAHIMSWVVPLTELLGGIALLAGAFIMAISVPLIITMLIALFTVQAKFGYSSVKTIGLTPQGPAFGPPGYEINLLYIATLLCLMLTGAGAYSIDSLLSRIGHRNVANAKG
jgi:putative oxidoreductase